MDINAASLTLEALLHEAHQNTATIAAPNRLSIRLKSKQMLALALVLTAFVKFIGEIGSIGDIIVRSSHTASTVSRQF
jgi:hypothetical protein